MFEIASNENITLPTASASVARPPRPSRRRPSDSDGDRTASDDESAPRPMRDSQTVRHLVGRAVVAGHGGRRCPLEVIVQHFAEPVVAAEADVDERLIETRDRSTVHLLVRTVAAVDPHNRGLVTVRLGIRRRATECLAPVPSEPLGVVGSVSQSF